MRVDIHGLAFETPQVTVHLFSPWRAAALEHRMFEAVRALPRSEVEKLPDEWRMRITDPKTWRSAAWRPCCPRKAATMPTMRAASMPSRSPMTNVGSNASPLT